MSISRQSDTNNKNTNTYGELSINKLHRLLSTAVIFHIIKYQLIFYKHAQTKMCHLFIL